MSIPSFNTKYGRTTIKYKAIFISKDWLGKQIKLVREYWAVNKYQADKIAIGISKKNNWLIETVRLV